MGDLVDQHPQVLVEQPARDRLLDQVELCRARILIAADPAEKEPGEPRLSLVSGDRCLGGVVSANHGNGIPLTRAVDAHAIAADQLADGRCRTVRMARQQAASPCQGPVPGELSPSPRRARLPAFQRLDPLAQASVLRGQLMLA